MARQVVDIEVDEMKDAHVNFISLVKRGAMRVPFRILKSEDESMFNLTRLWTKKSEIGVTPELIAVVLQKGSDVAGYTAALADMGVVVKKHEVHEESGTDVLVVKDDYDSEQSITMKFSDNVGAIVSNVKKGFCSWGDSTEFMDNMKISGFFPGVRMATDALMDTIYNCMHEVGEGEAPAAVVSKALDDFSAYVKQMAAEIPQIAFKMDSLEETVLKAAKAKCGECGTVLEADGKTCKGCGGGSVKKEEEVVKAEAQAEEVVTKVMDFPTALDTPMIVTEGQLKGFLGAMNVTDDALVSFLSLGSAFNEAAAVGVRSVQELITFLGAQGASDAQITAFLSAGNQAFIKKEEEVATEVQKEEGSEEVVVKDEESVVVTEEKIEKAQDEEGELDTALIQKAAKEVVAEVPVAAAAPVLEQIKKEGEIDLNQFLAMTQQLSSFMTNFRETVSEVVSPMMGEMVVKMDEKFTAVGATITTLQDSVKKAEEVAKKADEAVRGSVNLESAPEQTSALRTVTRKSDPNDGLFDTAFKFPGLE